VGIQPVFVGGGGNVGAVAIILNNDNIIGAPQAQAVGCRDEISWQNNQQ
jgi:hypothetical protein